MRREMALGQNIRKLTFSCAERLLLIAFCPRNLCLLPQWIILQGVGFYWGGGGAVAFVLVCKIMPKKKSNSSILRCFMYKSVFYKQKNYDVFSHLFGLVGIVVPLPPKIVFSISQWPKLFSGYSMR